MSNNPGDPTNDELTLAELLLYVLIVIMLCVGISFVLDAIRYVGVQ
jgi:hypothetical protein